MNHNTPLSPRPLHHLSDVRHRVLTARQLREHGISAADLAERCRPGGPWQQILPGVHLLHPGPPTSEERLHAVLLYAARRTPAAPACDGEPSVPAQGGTDHRGPEAMITGLAALALHRFSSAPPLLSLDRIDVLVPRTRRLRSAGFAQVVRAQTPPAPVEVTGLPVAPVPRALADAVGRLAGPQAARPTFGVAGTEVTALEAAGGPTAVRRLLTEAVRGGHCDPAAVVSELSRARLLGRPHVVDAVDGLLAEGRALAEGRLYEMVRTYRLPDPVWNVDLRLPGGPFLGGVDAYWPLQAVALTLDARAAKYDDEALWPEHARTRDRLERLGITVVQLTPKKLRDSLEQQATVVRTALMAAADREPSAYVAVLPR